MGDAIDGATFYKDAFVLIGKFFIEKTAHKVLGFFKTRLIKRNKLLEAFNKHFFFAGIVVRFDKCPPFAEVAEYLLFERLK